MTELKDRIERYQELFLSSDPKYVQKYKCKIGRRESQQTKKISFAKKEAAIMNDYEQSRYLLKKMTDKFRAMNNKNKKSPSAFRRGTITASSESPHDIKHLKKGWRKYGTKEVMTF